MATVYSVMTTVRSAQKGPKFIDPHEQYDEDSWSNVITEDTMKHGDQDLLSSGNALNHVLISIQDRPFGPNVASDRCFEAAVHCATSFHFNKRDLIHILLVHLNMLYQFSSNSNLSP